MYIDQYRGLVRFNEEKMSKVNLFTSSRMFADLYCLLPAQEQRVHSHADSDKVYHLLEGRCTCIVGEEERELRAGETCIAEAGVPHGLRNDSGENAVLLVMMAGGEVQSRRV